MKALTVKQPWASLICTPRIDNPGLGVKDIENRTWRTKYRGRVYIHSSAKPAFVGSYKENLPLGFWDGLTEEDRRVYLLSIQHRGAIIGEIDIVDCVINHSSIWAEKGFSYASYDGTQYKEVYNWVLANPVLYPEPIINVKGKLSFWEFDPDLYE